MESEKLKSTIKNQFTELKNFITFIGDKPATRDEAITYILIELYNLIKDSNCKKIICTTIENCIVNNANVLKAITEELEKK